MGAWSEDNFGNDDAGDWVWGLEKSKGLDTLLAPIRSVLSENDYLESPICSEALAACEIIAAAVTGDESLIPQEAKNWLGKKQGLIFGSKPNIEVAHSKMALEAVKKITSGSELQELWEENGENKTWRAVQNTLIAKLENA
ncbi:hypothetical protein R50072_36710 [Simiduia litorea]|uniref:DUF4259 domain-containing protein n=1 Tax=Simiduia litorea TaxID=1435348 RepID=UPI0036F21D6C